MAGKMKKKTVKRATKSNKGEKYFCDVCGLTVKVDKECSCNPCDIVCCGQDMKAVGCC